MRALPGMYALCPRAVRHTYQAKPECNMLQLVCNTYQADSLYRVINHPTQFDYGSTASTFWLRLVMLNGHILGISWRILVKQV